MGMQYQPQVLVISDSVYQQALEQQRQQQVEILQAEKKRLEDRLKGVEAQLQELTPAGPP